MANKIEDTEYAARVWHFIEVRNNSLLIPSNALKYLRGLQDFVVVRANSAEYDSYMSEAYSFVNLVLYLPL